MRSEASDVSAGALPLTHCNRRTGEWELDWFSMARGIGEWAYVFHSFISSVLVP